MGKRARFTLASLTAVAVIAFISCRTFDVPAEICNPGGLNAKLEPGQSDEGCSRCLEEQCCDAVGRCERQASCAGAVRSAHLCVLEAARNGASAERDCAKRLSDNREADDAYRCMRDRCGTTCGLPVCKVDKAVQLLRNAKCDECFAGGCCSELNRCYESRGCKLMVECIASECGSELGPSLDDASATLLGLPDPEVACRPDAVVKAAPRCALSCLCRYRANEQGLPLADPSLAPMRLAASVYECGKVAACGKDCTPGPDGVDADR